MLHILRTISALSVMAGTAEPARFLAYLQIPSPSHHFVFRGVMEALADRGHEVLYVTPLPYEEPPKGIKQIILPKVANGEDKSKNKKLESSNDLFILILQKSVQKKIFFNFNF